MTANPPPPKEAAFFAAIREWNLTRGDDGVISGVVDGLGKRIGLAPVPSRIIVLLAAVVLTGPVLLAYAAAWALLPDSRGNIIIQNFGRGITNVGALIGIALLTLVGLGDFNGDWGLAPWNWAWDAGVNGPTFFGMDGFSGPVNVAMWGLSVVVGLALVGALVYLVVWLVRKARADARAGSATTFDGTASAVSNTEATVDEAVNVAAATVEETVEAAVQDAVGADPFARQTGSQNSPNGMPAWTRRAPGPGVGGYLAFLGLILVSGAVAFSLERQGELVVSPILAWVAAFAVGFGALLMVIALMGRRLGFLGFLSVLVVAAAVGGSAVAAEARENYDGAWGWWDDPVYDDGGDVDVEDEWVGPELVSLGERFAGLYSSSFSAGQCYSPSDADPWEDATLYADSTATEKVPAVTEDTSVELLAGLNAVTIPAGTSWEIVSGFETQVVWPERDLSCWVVPPGVSEEDGWAEVAPAPVLSLTNSGDPVLTLEPQRSTTIYVREASA